MKFFIPLVIALLLCAGQAHAQVFPNPATLSTGQGTPGTSDPIWTVSGWYATNPPNPIGLTYNPALINNNCAPGSWVDPASLPPPTNNGNWITGATACNNNTNDGYIYFRLTLDLPTDCNGNSVATTGSYTLYLSGYVDNQITDVFVNGTSTGTSGGGFSAGSQLNFSLSGPWVPGTNYIDVQVYNFPNGGTANPYGLLLVANSAASSVNDGDNDGIADINDQCPCDAGNISNGCVDVIASGDSVICLGESTTLTATGSGTIVWNTGATGASITVSPTTNTRYSVVATASNGYQDSSEINVVVNSLPVVTISPAAQVICAGNSATLTGNGAAGYLWSNSAIAGSITVSPANTTTYSVTGADANQCTATASATITVNPLPAAAVNPAAVAICIGGSTTLTASGGTAYLWSNAANTAATTVSPATSTSYNVTVTDANNCSSSVISSVTVNALPVVAVNPSSTAICPAQNTTLTASGGTSYLWSNGDNTAATIVSPATTTSYNVTVTDANNCSASVIGSVTVNPLPVVTITPASTAVCIGASATLTAAGGTSYAWGGGQTTAAITVTPATTTPYDVTVTDANTCTATGSATVTVNALPVAAVSPAAATICEGTSTTLTATGGISYSWGNSSNTAAITVSPSATTTYSVTVTDANTCSATADATLTVNPLPIVSISLSDPFICSGESITLTATGGTTYVWSDGSANAVLTVSLSDSAIYTVTVTDANTCSGSIGVAVNVVPAMVLTTIVTDAACNGNADGSINLTATSGQSPYSYLWNISAATNEDPSGLTAGTYSVTVTDAGNCTATASATINEPAALTYTSTIANPFCISLPDNGSISIDVTGGTQPYAYTWTSGFTTAQIVNAAPGNYGVTVSDANNCTVTDAFTLAYLYDFSIQAVPDVTINLGESTILGYTVTGVSGNLTNVWSPAGTLSCSDCIAPESTPNTTTLYNIVVTNDSGCVASSSVTVTVEPDYSVFVPTAFTPNNDGNNDVFSIYFGTAKSLAFLEIAIFNRIGEKVFESQDHTFAWDGSYKGVVQQPGVYTWQMKLTFLNGHREEVRKGTVTILK